jgi:hypothetical protein
MEGGEGEAGGSESEGQLRRARGRVGACAATAALAAGAVQGRQRWRRGRRSAHAARVGLPPRGIPGRSAALLSRCIPAPCNGAAQVQRKATMAMKGALQAYSHPAYSLSQLNV